MISSHIFSKINYYSREFFWVLFGNSLFILGNFIFLKFISNNVKPNYYGTFFLGLTVVSGFNQIFGGPFINSIHRHIPIINKHNKIFYLNSVAREYIFKYVLLNAIVFLAIYLIKSFLFFDFNFIFFLFLYSIIQGINDLLISYNDAQRNRKINAFFKGFEPFLRLFILFVVIKYFYNSATSLVLVYFLSVSLSSFFLISKTDIFQRQRSLKTLYSKKLKDSINSYGYKTMVYGIFTWLLLSTDKWAIEYFIGSYDLGLYVIIYQIGYYPMTFIGNIISQFYTPIFYQKETNIYLRKFMFLILVISLIISFLSWQFNNEITRMLLSDNYLKHSIYLPILVLSGGIYSSGQYLSIHFQKKMMLGLLMKIKIFTSSVGILIYCLLTYFYGVKGLIFGSLIFSSLFFIIMNAFSLKIDRNEKIFKG